MFNLKDLLTDENIEIKNKYQYEMLGFEKGFNEYEVNLIWITKSYWNTIAFPVWWNEVFFTSFVISICIFRSWSFVNFKLLLFPFF